MNFLKSYIFLFLYIFYVSSQNPEYILETIPSESVLLQYNLTNLIKTTNIYGGYNSIDLNFKYTVDPIYANLNYNTTLFSLKSNKLSFEVQMNCKLKQYIVLYTNYIFSEIEYFKNDDIQFQYNFIDCNKINFINVNFAKNPNSMYMIINFDTSNNNINTLYRYFFGTFYKKESYVSNPYYSNETFIYQIYNTKYNLRLHDLSIGYEIQKYNYGKLYNPNATFDFKSINYNYPVSVINPYQYLIHRYNFNDNSNIIYNKFNNGFYDIYYKNDSDPANLILQNSNYTYLSKTPNLFVNQTYNIYSSCNFTTYKRFLISNITANIYNTYYIFINDIPILCDYLESVNSEMLICEIYNLKLNNCNNFKISFGTQYFNNNNTIYNGYIIEPSIYKPNLETFYTTSKLYGLNPSIEFSDYTFEIIYTGVSIIIIIFCILLFLGKYSFKYSNILTKLDFIRYKNRNITPIESEDMITNPVFNSKSNSIQIENSNELKLGLGYRIRYRTTVFGGILTIISICVSILLVIIYLYSIYNNNKTISINTSISNNYRINDNNIDIKFNLSFLQSSSNYDCVKNYQNNIESYGECSDFTNKFFSISGLNGKTNLMCYQKPVINTDFKICTVIFICTECGSFVSTDPSIKIPFYSGDISYINYTFQSTSYLEDEPSITSGTLISKNGYNLQYLSDGISMKFSVNPVVLKNFDSKISTGYITDLVSSFYNSRPYYDNTPIDYISSKKYLKDSNYNPPSTFTIYISKNYNWLYINVEIKNTNIVLIAQIFAIVSGTFSIFKYIVSFLLKDYFVNLYNKLCFRYKLDKSHTRNRSTSCACGQCFLCTQRKSEIQIV